MLIAGCLAMLFVTTVLGLGLGSHQIAPVKVVEALVSFNPPDNDHLIVVHSRIPRTVLAIVVGIALGLAGTMMQSITRNPLADPGLFGINAGAAAAVVFAIAIFGISRPSGYVWFSFFGAAVAALLVYGIGSSRRGSTTPARMALAGAAISVAIAAGTDMVLLSNERLFGEFRYWAVGTVQGRPLAVVVTLLPFLMIGVLLAIALIRPLNALTLGEDTARSLGSRPGVTRAGAAICIVLLAGSATAAAGPIAFVGLAAPHLVRLMVGADHRFLIPGVLVAAPTFLLVADLIGRSVVAPAELQTGIAAAILGGPVFVTLVRSRRLVT